MIEQSSISMGQKLCLPSGLWNPHPETALKTQEIWQYESSWSKKFARRSRSYGEQHFLGKMAQIGKSASAWSAVSGCEFHMYWQ